MIRAHGEGSVARPGVSVPEPLAFECRIGHPRHDRVDLLERQLVTGGDHAVAQPRHELLSPAARRRLGILEQTPLVVAHDG